MTERNPSLNSLNETKNKINKSSESKAKLLLVSEKDIYNFIAEESRVYAP
jgi:hypothetical protein